MGNPTATVRRAFSCPCARKRADTRPARTPFLFLILSFLFSFSLSPSSPFLSFPFLFFPSFPFLPFPFPFPFLPFPFLAFRSFPFLSLCCCGGSSCSRSTVVVVVVVVAAAALVVEGVVAEVVVGVTVVVGGAVAQPKGGWGESITKRTSRYRSGYRPPIGRSIGGTRGSMPHEHKLRGQVRRLQASLAIPCHDAARSPFWAT